MHKQNERIVTSHELQLLLNDFRKEAGDITTDLLMPLLLYYRYRADSDEKKATTLASQYTIPEPYCAVNDELVSRFAYVRYSDLLYVKFMGRYSEPVYVRESDYVPMLEAVRYLTERALALHANLLAVQNIERFFAYQEREIIEVLRAFLGAKDRNILVKTDKITKLIVQEMMQEHALNIHVTGLYDADEYLQKSTKVMMGLFPEYSKKGRIHLQSGDVSRLELEELLECYNYYTNRGINAVIAAVVRPAVLYNNDSQDFRNEYVGNLSRVLALPFAVKKYTTTRLYMLEFDNNKQDSPVQFCAFEPRNQKDSCWEPRVLNELNADVLKDHAWDRSFGSEESFAAPRAYWTLGEATGEEGLFRGKFLAKRPEKNDNDIVYSIDDVEKENLILELNVRSIQDSKLCIEHMPLDIFDGSYQKNQRYFCKEGDIILTTKGTLIKTALFPVGGAPMLDSGINEENKFNEEFRQLCWLGVYMSIDTYKKILCDSVSLLISSNLLSIRFMPSFVKALFDDAPDSYEILYSYWTRYVALVMRHENLGTRQFLSLQTGGDILINLTTEKVREFKIPKMDSFEQLRSFVDIAEKVYMQYEKDCRVYRDNLAIIYERLQ